MANDREDASYLTTRANSLSNTANASLSTYTPSISPI